MRNLLFLIVLAIPVLGYSQHDCKKYVEKKCDIYGEPFKFSGQSRNALFEVGQKSMFNLVVYGGFEYRIAVCADKNLKDIFFRIRENDTNKTVIYDSSSEIEDYLEKMFVVEESKNLLIEVVIPDGDTPKEAQSYKERFGCVGVVVEYYRRRDVGFD